MMAGTTPIKTLAGKLIQVLITFTDVTRLRQLQDHLSSLGMMIGTVSHDLKGCLTGLGLFIANKTVQKHGGRITVDSLPGMGTTFYIRLPRRVPITV